MKKCKKCGKKYDERKAACPYCGKKNDSLSKNKRNAEEKRGKYLLIAFIIIIVVGLGFAGYFAVNAILNTEVDAQTLMDEVVISGVNEDGKITGGLTVNADRKKAALTEIDDEDKAAYISEFIDTIKYTADKKEKLSNDTKIKITASYDKELAKSNHISVKNSEFTYTVKDLGYVENLVSYSCLKIDKTVYCVVPYMSTPGGAVYKVNLDTGSAEKVIDDSVVSLSYKDNYLYYSTAQGNDAGTGYRIMRVKLETGEGQALAASDASLSPFGLLGDKIVYANGAKQMNLDGSGQVDYATDIKPMVRDTNVSGYSVVTKEEPQEGGASLWKISLVTPTKTILLYSGPAA